MTNHQLLNALYELANLFFILFALMQIWALSAWPPKTITKNYPPKIRLLFAWPFGTAWLENIREADIPALENYQRRSRIGIYLGAFGALLFLLSLLGQ
ncbi:MAG: hypothetical protein HY075_00650 [Deltaproteobacteria bacterium]|nr:hypothetical protein [Deltaproteobacteria bacterium]